MSKRNSILASFFLLASVWITGGSAFASEAPLRIAVESHGSDLVEIRLTNVTDGPLSVLRWGTPFEVVMSQDSFDIYLTADSLETNLAYKGRRVKRGDPLPEDFIELAAGESLQQFLSLSVYYAVPEQGSYTLEYNGPITFRSIDNQGVDQSLNQGVGEVNRRVKAVGVTAVENRHQSAQLASDSIALELTPSPETRAARVPAYFSCSAGQQTELQAALQASELITNVARDDLAGLVGDARLNSPRYKNWFGEYSAERFQIVFDTFDTASNVMANSQIEFDCRCEEEGLYAYVFPSDPYRIYPCPNFWAASLTGTDSRAGTVLHELAHFPAINGADDFEYGKLSVAQLAITNPEKSVNNADSYEYFAENTPNLPISNLVVFSDMAIGISEVSDLSVGESSFYKVRGADYVELTSTVGDADLYVYDSAANENVICQSLSVELLDRCELDASATAYIEVRGHVASQYAVVAQLDSSTQPEPEPEQTPDGPVVTPTGGSSGGAGGDTSGAGTSGLFIILLLAVRRLRRFGPGVPARKAR